jgi:hypothetical protein
MEEDQYMSQAALNTSYGPTIPLPQAEPEAVEEVGSVGMLLKSPTQYARLVAQDRVDWQPMLIMSMTALGFFALYGLATGCLAGGNALWQAALKTPLIVACSLGVCAPCLHVLLGLAGHKFLFRQIVAILSGAAGVASVLMVCFAPVVWLFGVSTRNAPFMTFVHLSVWGVGLSCGLRLVTQLVPGGVRDCKVLMAWTAVFLMVCAQMTTYFQPILGVAVDGGFREKKGQFFLQHFAAALRDEQPGTAPQLVIPVSAPAPMPMPSDEFIPVPSPKPVSN